MSHSKKVEKCAKRVVRNKPWFETRAHTHTYLIEMHPGNVFVGARVRVHMVHIGASFLASVDADPRIAVHHSVAFASGKAEWTDFGDDGRRLCVAGENGEWMAQSAARVAAPGCCERGCLAKTAKTMFHTLQIWDP